MNWLDWLVVFLYCIIIVGIALYIARSQRSIHDYYLAGKKIKWWQSGMSTMATQLSAISFVSAPAFVAIKSNGGLKWLSYELGVPLALILVMTVIIPVLHRKNYISIYEYLEDRFDATTRVLISSIFQIGRGLATAVAILAGGLILSTALSISTAAAIIVIGIITLLYDVLGGIRIVILSDVLQMLIIIAGILICGYTAIAIIGWENARMLFPEERTAILDFGHLGLKAEEAYAFWPMLIGGFFLYASYYGCDQSQVQRELSVENENAVKKSLMVNALGRFPVVLLYCILGVVVGSLFYNPEVLQIIAGKMHITTVQLSDLLQRDPDRMLPIFILTYLPHGIIGFIFVAIMAALMSSLDSGINSLSAATMKDMYQKYIKPQADNRHYVFVSRLLTFAWGIFCIVTALLLAGFGEATRQTTIVLINAVGSLTYGPILAAFLLGILFKHVQANAVKAGAFLGVAVNIYFKFFTDIAWPWYNVTGFLVTLLPALLLSKPFNNFYLLRLPQKEARHWKVRYRLVVVYFIFIILICFGMEAFFSGN
jgi:SSS family transporter